MENFDNVDSFDNEDNNKKNGRLSRSLRAGKRTYFFDLKEVEKDKLYLTITESKRRFDTDSGTYSHEKHKILIVKENIQHFYDEFGKIIAFIKENPEFKDVSKKESPNSEINTEELE